MPAARRVCVCELGVERERAECDEIEPIDGDRQRQRQRAIPHGASSVRERTVSVLFVHVVTVGWSRRSSCSRDIIRHVR